VRGNGLKQQLKATRPTESHGEGAFTTQTHRTNSQGNFWPKIRTALYTSGITTDTNLLKSKVLTPQSPSQKELDRMLRKRERESSGA